MKYSQPLGNNSVGTATLQNGAVTPSKLSNGINELTIFTANGNFNPQTSGNYYLWMKAGGDGGGGGRSVAAAAAEVGEGGEGGGEGPEFFGLVALVAGNNYPVVIGAGGTGGASDISGNKGGATTFNGVQTTGQGNLTLPGQMRVPNLTGTVSGSGKAGHGAGGGGGVAGVTGQAAGTNGNNGAAGTGAGGSGGSGASNQAGTTANNGGTGGTGGSGNAKIWRA